MEILILGAGFFAVVVMLKVAGNKNGKRSALKLCLDEINTQTKALQIKKMQLVYEDHYGTVHHEKWEKEKAYFIETRIIPRLRSGNLSKFWSEIGTQAFLAVELASRGGEFLPPEELTRPISDPSVFSPAMDPIDYERHCAMLLQRAGWQTRMTALSGDQGADVIATRGGKTLVVQCKLYSTPVGNKAVQEAHAARTFQQAHYAAVVTNAGFTLSAKQLANVSRVSLLHHEQLTDFVPS